MSKTVVLGGSGFIGRWVCRSLVSAGRTVYVVDRKGAVEDVHGSVAADARDPAVISHVVEEGDTVVHLFHSSIPAESMSDPAAELVENVIPYIRVLETIAEKGAGLVVYSSSGGQVYGNAAEFPIPESEKEMPISNYGIAKLAMEHFTRVTTYKSGVPHIILRIGNPYGPLQELSNSHGIVPALFRAVRDNTVVRIFGGGITVRDYVYIEDVAESIRLLCETGACNETVNIGTGRGTSLSGLIKMVEKIAGGRVNLVEEPLRKSDVMENVLDISHLQELTGYTPAVGLEEGLTRFRDYFYSD
ncbi:MAG: NAD-dependent epimerase/dehydratase family protein [bacterium]